MQYSKLNIGFVTFPFDEFHVAEILLSDNFSLRLINKKKSITNNFISST